MAQLELYDVNKWAALMTCLLCAKGRLDVRFIEKTQQETGNPSELTLMIVDECKQCKLTSTKKDFTQAPK